MIVYDEQRHLACFPYSKDMLHIIAEQLGIKKCWFHKDHYDIPKHKQALVEKVAEKIPPKMLCAVIRLGSPPPEAGKEGRRD